ncbi:MAG: hypothetical protein GY859_30190, partial [Desulfobacterales bacterium]|nr:hypothetical protein [Desulfobacterales bacterium]
MTTPPLPENGSPDRDHTARLKRALLAMRKMKSRIEELERDGAEPMAVIGMGCRFPGGADNPRAFWRLLHEERDAVTEVPPDRWDVDAYYDPDPHAPGKIYTRHGGFLEGVDRFDPGFFGISRREAASLDPQQRLLLEVSWEALEDAGQAPEELAGGRTGVFVGISSSEYAQRLTARGPEKIDSYLGSGNAHAAAPGRLAYLLDAHGPGLAVDTACSSSLTAVHLACRSLRDKECDMALAGGVNLLLTPTVSINHSRAGMLPPDGRCKTFDAAADGFIRSDGCGVIVLKRLSRALENRDNILALIRGSAVNQDGRTSGLTAPSGPSQEAVIRQALENAGAAPSRVDYIEAHGTGTALGDPMEMGALAGVFGKDRPKDRPLVVGSVKTNLGHTEAAAGVAGLIKVVLSLQHRRIPSHLHFKDPNPRVEWSAFPVVVPTRRMPWPPGETPRCAGVSAFGFGGSNAHVVLEEYIPPGPREAAREDFRPGPLTLSAKTDKALRRLAVRYEKRLSADPSLDIADVCFTANTGRSHFRYRLAVAAFSTAEAAEKLAAFNAGQEAPGVFTGQAAASDPPATRVDASTLDPESLARHYVRGAAIHWADRYEGRPFTRIGLPTYPFQRHRCWVDETPAPRRGSGAGAAPDEIAGRRHPLLHRRLHLALGGKETRFETRLGANRPGWLKDHRVFDAALTPGAVHLEMALAAGRATLRTDHPVLEEIVFKEALVLPGEEEKTVQLVFTPGETDWRFHVLSLSMDEKEEEASWTLHVAGRVAGRDAPPARPPMDLDDLRGRITGERSPRDFYRRFRDRRIHFGPAFQAVEALWRNETEALGRLRLPASLARDAGAYHLHPVLLDASMQTLDAVFADPPRDQTWLQAGVQRFRVFGEAGGEAWCHARVRPFKEGADKTVVADVTLFDEGGRVIAEVEGLMVKQVHQRAPADDAPGLYEVAWRPGDRPAPPRPRAMANHLNPLLAEAMAAPELTRYGRALTTLDALDLPYILNALRQMGLSFTPGRRFSETELLQRLQVAAPHRRLFSRLLRILAEKGMLRRVDERWEILPAPPLPHQDVPDLDALTREMMARHPEAETELTLLNRCGSSLARVLQGK